MQKDMFVLTIIVAFLFQSQILHRVGLRLDLLLLTTLYYSFLYGWKRGCGVGLACGLVQDVFSSGMLGLGPVGLAACGLLAGFVRKRLLLRYWIVRVGLVFIFTILNLFIYFSLTKIFSQDKIYMHNWLETGVWNMTAAGVVFWLVDRYG